MSVEARTSDTMVAPTVEKIRETFAVPQSPVAHVVPSASRTDEVAEVRARFQGRRWQDVALEELGSNADDLCFMTPEAYVYYLPRFLIAALETFDEPTSAIVDDLVSQLTPRSDSSFVEERLELLTDSQKAMIARFLELVRDRSVASCTFLEENAEAALSLLWGRWLVKP